MGVFEVRGLRNAYGSTDGGATPRSQAPCVDLTVDARELVAIMGRS
jgi:hypothetical protein